MHVRIESVLKLSIKRHFKNETGITLYVFFFITFFQHNILWPPIQHI